MRLVLWLVFLATACSTTPRNGAPSGDRVGAQQRARSAGPIELAETKGWQLLVDSRYLYWSEQSGVFRLSKNGGTKERIVEVQVLKLLVDGAASYWLQEGAYNNTRRSYDYELRRLIKSGGTVETLATFPKSPKVLGQDEEALYYDILTVQDGFRRFIRRHDKTTGRTTELYEFPHGRLGSRQPQQLVVGKRQVFVTTSESRITCIDKSSGMC